MQKDLNALLKAVSRSFYLTIRLLPRGLKEPIGLAYLLARMSDTIADSTSAPAELRLAALRQMGRAICREGPMPDLTPFAAGVSDPSERILLARAEELGALLDASEPGDRAEIVQVLETILSGQILDVTRFACEGEGIKALSTAEELEDYTYRVAGCVGEFWTRICARHWPRYASMETEALVQLGISFGKGLQLVNVLRDAPADRVNGRCYLPRNELPGGDPELLKTDPEVTRPVYDRWMLRATGYLDDALLYIAAVRPWRMRLACFLPWAIGVRTLQRMERERPLEQPVRVKVPRSEVRRLILLGVLGACGNRLLRWAVARIKMQKM